MIQSHFNQLDPCLARANPLSGNILQLSPLNPIFCRVEDGSLFVTAKESILCPPEREKNDRPQGALSRSKCRDSRPRLSAARGAVTRTRASASPLLEFHLLNLHAAQEFAPAAPVSETLSLELRRGHDLCFPHQRHLDPVSARARQSRRRSALRRDPPQVAGLCRMAARHRHHQGNLPVPPALDCDRRVARHRVRPAQRPFRPSRKPLLFLLPAPPHGRHYGPRHQRSERGPHAAWPRHHVLGQHHGLHRGRAGLHDLHQSLAHALHIPAAACGERRDPNLRPPHSRALRKNSGHVLRHLGARAGEFFGSAPDPRLRAGRRRDPRFRNREPGIHSPQPETGTAHGNALAYARTHAGLRRSSRVVARRTRSHPRTLDGHAGHEPGKVL